MAGEYYIELRDFVSGSRLAIITGVLGGADGRNGFLRLDCRRQVNAPGKLTFVLPGNHPVLPLADKTQVVLWRRDLAHGIDWYREFVALFRDERHERKSSARIVRLECPGLMSLLDWYQVFWPANQVSRTVFTSAKAETVLKTLTTYNAVAASATAANGRDRNAPNYGISVAADTAAGNTISWTAGRAKTLLQELQAIATVAGGDFDLVYTSATTREFRWYSGQRGSDQSATITFAEHLGNMDNIVFSRVRSAERTIAIVGGQGTEASRETVVRTGANYSSSNDIETFVDARDVQLGATAALQARGDRRLDELESRNKFAFDVVQTEGVFYGPAGVGSYALGDLCSAVRPDGVTIPVKIAAVNPSWTPEGEQIGVEVATP